MCQERLPMQMAEAHARPVSDIALLRKGNRARLLELYEIVSHLFQEHLRAAQVQQP